jgi:hypothetical protein
MYAEKRVVIVVAVVLVVGALLFCNATPAVEAKLLSTLTISPSTTTPAANQPFTLSGTLKAGTTPLSGKTITLFRADPSGTWSTFSTTTAANGAYTFTRSEPQGRYYYYTYFAGDPYGNRTSSSTGYSVSVGA